MTTQVINLKSNDGVAFEVDVKVAEKSVLLRNMIQDTDMLEKGDSVTVPYVNGKVLKKVIEWSEHHLDDPEEKENDKGKEKRTDDINAWEVEFLKVNENILFDIIMAANFMDIEGLLDCSCKTVAKMIMGKTPEEIREMFNIKNDFSPEEEQKIKDENAWCEI